MLAVIFLCVTFNVGFRVGARREIESGLYVLANNVRFADPRALSVRDNARDGVACFL
jgi:hypothetical protein